MSRHYQIVLCFALIFWSAVGLVAIYAAQAASPSQSCSTPIVSSGPNGEKMSSISCSSGIAVDGKIGAGLGLGRP